MGQGRVVVLFKAIMIRHNGASTHIDFLPFTAG
jgi:hypothetical protein